MQFNSKFEMLIEVHEKMLELQVESNEEVGLGDIDRKIFIFRHKDNWLKNVIEVWSNVVILVK